MQCSCGLEMGIAQEQYKVHHVLKFLRCECGRQGKYQYYVCGDLASIGKEAVQDFQLLRAAVC